MYTSENVKKYYDEIFRLACEKAGFGSNYTYIKFSQERDTVPAKERVKKYICDNLPFKDTTTDEFKKAVINLNSYLDTKDKITTKGSDKKAGTKLLELADKIYPKEEKKDEKPARPIVLPTTDENKSETDNNDEPENNKMEEKNNIKDKKEKKKLFDSPIAKINGILILLFLFVVIVSVLASLGTGLIVTELPLLFIPTVTLAIKLLKKGVKIDLKKLLNKIAHNKLTKSISNIFKKIKNKNKKISEEKIFFPNLENEDSRGVRLSNEESRIIQTTLKKTDEVEDIDPKRKKYGDIEYKKYFDDGTLSKTTKINTRLLRLDHLNERINYVKENNREDLVSKYEKLRDGLNDVIIKFEEVEKKREDAYNKGDSARLRLLDIEKESLTSKEEVLIEIEQALELELEMSSGKSK